MSSDRYFYISALPALDPLGSAPPMGLAQVMEHVGERRDLAELVGCLLLLDDLLQREAHLAGELEEVDPVVLSMAQARGESPLPDYLQPDPDRTATAADADGLWEAYFRHADATAHRLHSRFLAAWVGFEVGLRNALASARARRLGLEEASYLVAVDLDPKTEDYSTLLSEWSAATTPLAGQKAILAARWNWIAEHDAWFTFRDDELAVYAARLMLLHQWQRITGEEDPHAAAASSE